MENTSISVVVPCYNYARFLPDAVASVVVQTTPASEIIIVDDGSTDNTVAVAQGLMARYHGHRIRLLRRPNAGPAAARNTGARHASGEFLLFLDADDRLAPTMLARTSAILRHRAEVGFVYTGMRLFGNDDHIWPSVPYDPGVLAIENIVLTQALVRHTCWAQVGGFDAARFPHGSEDWDFWLRLAAAGWRGWHVDEPLVLYRRHGRSLSDALRLDQDWDARAQIIRKHPGIYGPRLVAWATFRCARRNLAVAGTTFLASSEPVRELGPLDRPDATMIVTPAVGETAVAIPWKRRLVRRAPFRLRFRVKCLRRRVQLALRAVLPWWYID
jgi:glycosyltransferase involved in cell wall biosynthesis